MGLRLALAVVIVGVGAALAGAAVSGAGTRTASGTMTMNAALKLVSDPGPCPSGDATLVCAARTQTGPVPGLGQVTSAYTWIAALGQSDCPLSSGKVHSYTLRLTVGSKGTIDVTLGEGAQCVEQEAVRSQTQAFAVTGGTGAYAGASGSGSVESVLEAETATGRVGRATWKGTLAVAALDFDTTPPRITGATNRTVRAKKGAKSARVTYAVTASDDADGSVSTTCAPRSGSRFGLGKTKVTCVATDSSANGATASFTVTVKRR